MTWWKRTTPFLLFSKCIERVCGQTESVNGFGKLFDDVSKHTVNPGLNPGRRSAVLFRLKLARKYYCHFRNSDCVMLTTASGIRTFSHHRLVILGLTKFIVTAVSQSTRSLTCTGNEFVILLDISLSYY